MRVAQVSVGGALGLLSLAAFFAAPAYASLGADPASVRADQAELQGTLTLAHFPRFDLQTIVADNGIVVREFLGASGTVFAISWHGPVMPDMQRLLAARYEAYSVALAALDRPGLKRSLRIETPALVLENAGHLRAFSGYAYDPGLVPQGVIPRDLPW